MISSPTRVLTAIGTFAAATSLALAVVQPTSAAPRDDAGTVQLLVQVDPLNWGVDVLSYGTLLDVAVTAGSSQRAANSGPGDLLLARWDGSEVTFQMSGGLTSPAYPRERILSPIAMTLKSAPNGDLRLELGSIDGTGVPGYVPTRHSLTKHVHEASGSTYYQLRLGPAEPSPDEVPQKATANIGSLLRDGVSQGDCTVARKMRPGDTLTTGTGDEVVCVTLDVEPSTNRQLPYEPPIPPIRIDTGAGDDIVLIDGETDAKVIVELGSGDDVAVIDTSSNVTVVAGRGDDGLLDTGENTTFKGGAGVDIAIGASEGSSDWDRRIFGPGIECDLLPGTPEMRDKCRAKYAEK